MSLKFSPSLRLLKADEYSRIFKGGQSQKSQFWQVISKQNNQQNPRLGLAISKKNYRLAVDRNHLKRIAREAFRTMQNTLNRDFVVLAVGGKNHPKPYKNQILATELQNLLQKS